MKKTLKRTGIVLAVIVIVIVGGFIWLKSSAGSALERLTYASVDMNVVKDGTYTGEADAGLVYAKVDVTVKDHMISDIKIIEHRTGRGQKAETITGTMISQNKYDVDAVSGATLSSETIKSAVSKALEAGSK